MILKHNHYYADKQNANLLHDSEKYIRCLYLIRSRVEFISHSHTLKAVEASFLIFHII